MITLQDVIKAGVKHGDPFSCPNCTASGRIDIDTPFNSPPEMV